MKNYFNHKMRGKSPALIAGMIILAIIGIAALAILFGFVIMWLWNCLMPELFDLPTLSYWQAVGLFILSKILLGGIGGGGSSKSNKSSDPCDSKKKKKKGDFSKWEHYDNFWKEKGENEYAAYVEAINNPSDNSALRGSDDDENESNESNPAETE
jgi:hypothetical protein